MRNHSSNLHAIEHCFLMFQLFFNVLKNEIYIS